MMRVWVLQLMLLLSSFSAWCAEGRPTGHIQDSGSVLPLQMSRALEKVLAQHEAVSGETFFLVISSESYRSPSRRATELFESWKVDTVDPMKAVLLYLDPQKSEVEVRAGLGMTEFLSSIPLEKLTTKIFRAELGAGAPERAIVLSAMEVLQTLEDPHLQEARDSLETAGFKGGWSSEAASAPLIPLWPLMFIGGALGFLYVLFVALSGEAHYSSEGWVRVRHLLPPGFKHWLRKYRKKVDPAELVTGGGVSGHY